MPVIGITRANEKLRSTHSSLELRGGRLFAAQATKRVLEGGKKALGGLIPFFLDQVKPP